MLLEEYTVENAMKAERKAARAEERAYFIDLKNQGLSNEEIIQRLEQKFNLR